MRIEWVCFGHECDIDIFYIRMFIVCIVHLRIYLTIINDLNLAFVSFKITFVLLPSFIVFHISSELCWFLFSFSFPFSFVLVRSKMYLDVYAIHSTGKQKNLPSKMFWWTWNMIKPVCLLYTVWGNTHILFYVHKGQRIRQSTDLPKINK